MSCILFVTFIGRKHLIKTGVIIILISRYLSVMPNSSLVFSLSQKVSNVRVKTKKANKYLTLSLVYPFLLDLDYMIDLN